MCNILTKTFKLLLVIFRMKPVEMEALHLSPRLSPAQGGVRVLALKKHVPLLDVAFSRAEETRQPASPIWVSIKVSLNN